MKFLATALSTALFASCGSQASHSASWQDELVIELPRLGHRNFIVIADSAYPLQSSPGIRTIHIGGTQAEATRQVLALLKTQKHVRPVAWIDAEQNVVSEGDAPGMTKLRSELQAAL
jgi:L-fucose mutarotase/ribose pyranase (RbsD/FucU family)